MLETIHEKRALRGFISSKNLAQTQTRKWLSAEERNDAVLGSPTVDSSWRDSVIEVLLKM